MRTHTCGELDQKNVGNEVVLDGWVHRRREHGGLIFFDLRDRYGITQVTFDSAKIDSDAWSKIEEVRSEWVIQVTGIVVARPADMVNPKLKTGDIEVSARSLQVLNKSKTPPFEIDTIKANETNEALRLQYRFIDLRRPALQELLMLKDRYYSAYA